MAELSCKAISVTAPAADKRSRVDEFRDLREKRNTIVKTIAALNERLSEADEAIRTTLGQRTAEASPLPSARAMAATASPEEQQKAIQDFLAESRKREEMRTTDFNRTTGERKQIQATLQHCRDLLGDVDYAASNLIEIDKTEGRFRIYTSLVFAGLVALVIGGFFGIAYSDERIKFAIFANDSGIQFITLFSIVIAVILFGIIGVLEGKELSALLGGLSGYILGRGAGFGPKTPPDQNGKTPPVGGTAPIGQPGK
jgi:hypothetical protein